jgi:polyisoprenyl-teichoic acid--peptidoglycan teichoic acid transferase
VRLMPRTRRGALWRFFLGAVIVIGASAATTAVAGLLQFKQLAADISLTPALPHANVTLPSPGQPQTILIIGSDHRAGEPFRAANTDTILLVRLNGNSQTINVLSVPRDLQVNVPGEGIAKINSAYSVGGPNLLISILRQQVFPGLHVNHIVDINFRGFVDLVNAIGCVYTDVDHRYYNVSAPGPNDFSSINIQPGYQKLCGTLALEFVRFRHTDSDLVRNARQQDFIRWAKDQYGIDNLIANRDRLLRIFGANTETDHDLHTTDGLINLFNLVAFSDGHTIKQIKFPALFLPCDPTGTVPCYVAPTSTGAEHAAFADFMRPTQTAPHAKHPTFGPHAHHAGGISTAGLIADTTDGKSQAQALHSVKMPVYYPKLIMAQSQYCTVASANCDDGAEPETAYDGSYPRAYQIRDQDGHLHAAYRMTIDLNSLLGEYYGVQGTTWQIPPLLGSPSGTKVVNGRKLFLYAQGGSITNVAWHTPQGVYWISNTLTNNISNTQMVAIASSFTRGS